MNFIDVTQLDELVELENYSKQNGGEHKAAGDLISFLAGDQQILV